MFFHFGHISRSIPCSIGQKLQQLVTLCKLIMNLICLDNEFYYIPSLCVQITIKITCRMNMFTLQKRSGYFHMGFALHRQSI